MNTDNIIDRVKKKTIQHKKKVSARHFVSGKRVSVVKHVLTDDTFKCT